MQLVTLDGPIGGGAGVVIGDEVLELDAALHTLGRRPPLPRTVEGLLAAPDGALRYVDDLRLHVQSEPDTAERLRGSGSLKSLATSALLAPLPFPRLVLSCGANYRAHLAEMGSPVPTKPVAFLKNPHAVIGPNAPIRLPAGHDRMVDWEAEFCGVIGRTCHRVDVDEALDYIVGYTMMIDVSARDWAAEVFQPQAAPDVVAAWDANILGKQFATFCPMGPTIATKDEISDPALANFSLKVGTETKQSACTSDLVFSLAALIAHYSQWYTFHPGDVISTGSPSGVGFGRNPPEFLRPGDTVTVEAEGIGRMTNPVIESGG